jgi:hypothetical protein
MSQNTLNFKFNKHYKFHYFHIIPFIMQLQLFARNPLKDDPKNETLRWSCWVTRFMDSIPNGMAPILNKIFSHILT